MLRLAVLGSWLAAARGWSVRVGVASGLVAVGLAGVPATAGAHGDARLVDGVVVLGPGRSARFEGELHYHRLVGRVEADGPVVVRLVESGREAPAVEAGPAEHVALNALVRCCDDRAWARHTLLIENVGDGTVTARARVGLVHDDLAVMAYGAESGVTESLAVFGLVWSGVLWGASGGRPGRGSLRRAAAGFALLTGLAVALSLYGAARYGAGGVPGLVAALSDLPVLPSNRAVSGTTLLVMAGLLGCGLVGVWWADARSSARRAAWLCLGLALAGAIGATAALVASTYGAVERPATAAAFAAVPLLALLAGGLRER